MGRSRLWRNNPITKRIRLGRNGILWGNAEYPNEREEPEFDYGESADVKTSDYGIQF